MLCAGCGSQFCNYNQAEEALEKAQAAFRPYEALPYAARFSGEAKVHYDKWVTAKEVYDWARSACRNRFVSKAERPIGL